MLEIEEDSTLEDIKYAYYKMAQRYHPDKAQGDREEFLKEKFQEILEAYNILSDQELRAKFDLELRPPPSSQTGQQFEGPNIVNPFKRRWTPKDMVPQRESEQYDSQHLKNYYSFEGVERPSSFNSEKER